MTCGQGWTWRVRGGQVGLDVNVEGKGRAGDLNVDVEGEGGQEGLGVDV